MRAKEFIVEDHTFADTGNAWENGKKDAMNFRPKNVEKYHLRHKYRSHYSDGYNVGLKRRDRSINPETGKPYIKFGPNGPITPEQGVAEGEMNFEEGDCPVFAIALHRLSKLPLMALVEYDEQMGSAVLIHAYVKLNNKWRIDATGETDVDWMLQKYPNNGNAEEIEISEKDLIKLGYGKNKCPMLQQVLPHAKEVLQTIDNEQGVAEGTDPDKKYTIKKSYTMSKAGVEKAVWYIMDGDFVVDVTDLRRDAKYYADKWNAAEKESSNASQNPHKPAVAEGSQTECPPATQDITLNLKNRQKAIDEYGYGPLNPDMPNTKFWMKKVDEWNLDSAEEAKQSLCGNCAAFDQRQHTLDCIAQGIDSDNPEDAEGIIDAGELGYCKFLKFKCASRRTCDAWVTGGPLVDKQRDSGR